MLTRKWLLLIAAIVALLPVCLFAQQQGLEYVLTDQGYKAVTPMDTVIVDGVTHAAQLLGGDGCGGEYAAFDHLPEGFYAFAISGGPGISYQAGGYYSVGVHMLLSIFWEDGWETFGLHGYGSMNNKRSYVLYRVPPGIADGGARFYIADTYCGDNDGYVEVTLYRITD